MEDKEYIVDMEEMKDREDKEDAEDTKDTEDAEDLVDMGELRTNLFKLKRQVATIAQIVARIDEQMKLPLRTSEKIHLPDMSVSATKRVQMPVSPSDRKRTGGIKQRMKTQTFIVVQVQRKRRLKTHAKSFSNKVRPCG